MDSKSIQILTRFAFNVATLEEENKAQFLIKKSSLNNLFYQDLVKESDNFLSYDDYISHQLKQKKYRWDTIQEKINLNLKSSNFRIAFNSISKKITSELIQTAEYLNEALVKTFNTPNQTMIIPLSQVRSGKVKRKRIPNTSVDFQGDFALFKEVLKQCFSTLETQNGIVIEFENNNKILLISIREIDKSNELKKNFEESEVFQIICNM